MRKRWFRALFAAGLFAVLASAFASPAHADVFFTGRVDFDTPVVDVAAARRAGFASTGVSYTNRFSGGASPAVGDVVHAIGFVVVNNAGQGGSTIDFNTGNRLVAVYALNGQIIDASPTSLRALFTSGQIRLYDRGTGAIDINDPSTWVTNISDLNQGVLAKLNLSNEIPSAVIQGAPGGLQTEAIVVNTALLNTAAVDLTGATLGSVADFIFDYISGTFASNFDVQNPANPGVDIVPPADPQFIVRINQTLQNPPLATPDVTELNTIFGAFKADLGFAGEVFAGTTGQQTFNPQPLGPTFTGDTVHQNDGGFAVPGAQQAEIPEPASMLLWGTILVGAGVYGGLRRRRQRAA
jgi:hypothetical protein